MEEPTKGKRINKHAGVLIALHVLLLVYSLGAFFSKNASFQPFFSFWFFVYYGGMLAILAIYAVGWQQILKRLPLTVAFANKAIVVVWTILWGVIFFGEKVTASMVIGAALVIAGIVVFSIADGEDRREAEQAAKAEAASGEGNPASEQSAGDAGGTAGEGEQPTEADAADPEQSAAETGEGERS